MIHMQKGNRKSIAVVALDPLAGASYKQEIEGLFGDYADVTGYSVRMVPLRESCPMPTFIAINVAAMPELSAI